MAVPFVLLTRSNLCGPDYIELLSKDVLGSVSPCECIERLFKIACAGMSEWTRINTLLGATPLVLHALFGS
jgi:hypothetical protein